MDGLDRFTDMLVEVLRGPRGPEVAALVLARAPEPMLHPPILAVLLREVARAAGVSVVEMRGPSRRRSVSDGRAVFAFLARAHTNATFTAVGLELGGKDHSSVIAAARRVADVVGSPRFSGPILEVERRLALGNSSG